MPNAVVADSVDIQAALAAPASQADTVDTTATVAVALEGTEAASRTSLTARRIHVRLTHPNLAATADVRMATITHHVHGLGTAVTTASAVIHEPFWR